MATKKSSSAAPAKRSSSGSGSRAASSAPRAEAPKRMSGPKVAQAAVQQLIELVGKQPEGVTGLQRTEDGWTVQVEVLEVRRVPDTTDVLSSYEVDMDSDGDLMGYRRLRRYVRGVPGES
jgi:hypothetical protein